MNFLITPRTKRLDIGKQHILLKLFSTVAKLSQIGIR